MPTLKLFVASHDNGLLERVPDLPYVHKINLRELDLPQEYRSESLSENRLFLSEVALRVSEDWIGIVSPRLLEREPQAPGFEEFEDLITRLGEGSFWSPRFLHIEGDLDRNAWIASQDGVHPGMSRILRFAKDTCYEPEALNRSGPLFLGNQFIVNREEWLAFIKAWRGGLYAIVGEYGLTPPFEYRCWMCGKKHPDGFGRYTKARHLGFIGERLTGMHFSTRGLTSSTSIMQHQTQDKTAFGKSLLFRVTGHRLFSWFASVLWVVQRLPKRSNCSIC